jgi:hypothetical protein
MQILVPKKASASACAIPRCEACQYAKLKRNRTATTVKHRAPAREGALSDGVLEPGQNVSVDLFQSTILVDFLTPEGNGNGMVGCSSAELGVGYDVSGSA